MTGAAAHAAWIGRDGSRFELRPIAAGDTPLLASFLRRLSFGTRYFRYGRGDIEIGDDEIRRMCAPDPARAAGLVVLQGLDQKTLAVGAGQIVYEPGESSCEFTLTVSDSWQRRGIGKRLLDALIRMARERGHVEIHARVLATNQPMLSLVQRLGFALFDSRDGPGVKIARLNMESAAR